MASNVESGDLVAFAAAAVSAEDGLLAGEPGTVIDVNAHVEVVVSFQRGPSISVAVTYLEEPRPVPRARRAKGQRAMWVREL